MGAREDVARHWVPLGIIWKFATVDNEQLDDAVDWAHTKGGELRGDLNMMPPREEKMTLDT